MGVAFFSVDVLKGNIGISKEDRMLKFDEKLL